MNRPTLFIVLILGIAVIGVGAYLLVFQKEKIITNGNQNISVVNRETLPESHSLTVQERIDLGIPDGIEGNVVYSYDEQGNVLSTFEITSDTRAADGDTDGISDEREEEFGTDPANPDSDDDGWRDGDEVAHGSDPLKRDTDGDGLGDLDEFSNYHTDPINSDTDGDGYNDGTEVNRGFDPLTAG